jgi:hypothetical protein
MELNQISSVVDFGDCAGFAAVDSDVVFYVATFLLFFSDSITFLLFFGLSDLIVLRIAIAAMSAGMES